LIWGSEWLATQAIEVPPLRALASRYAIAVVILSLAATIWKIQMPHPNQALRVSISGITILMLPSILIAWATARVSPGLLVVLLAMIPLIAALIEGRATGTLLTALVGGIAGITLIASQGLSFSAAQWPRAGAILLAAALIAGSVVYIKRSLGEVHPVMIAGFQFGSAAVGLFALSAVLESHAGALWTPSAIRWAIALAILANAVAFPLYYWLLNQQESYQLTVTQWLVTTVGVAEGLILVRQEPSWRVLVGIVLVLGCIAALWGAAANGSEEVTIQLTDKPFRG
jgi:drug/metabolite transporter (DMT)-like permease